jgi:hypothetical protein
LANYLGESGFSISTDPLNELTQDMGQKGIIEQYRRFFVFYKNTCVET